MKPKLILMAALCAICLCSYAQTERGSGLAGLSLSVGTARQNPDENSLNSFTLTPRFGYFLRQNLSIGLELPFILSKWRGASYTRWNTEDGRYEQAYGPKELSFGFSPYLRKYVNIKERFKFFGQVNGWLQINTFNVIDADDYLVRTDVRLKGLGVSLSPGFALFITDDSSIEFSFPIVTFFHQNYYDSESLYNYKRPNNLRLALDNFTPTLGVNIHF